MALIPASTLATPPVPSPAYQIYEEPQPLDPPHCTCRQQWINLALWIRSGPADKATRGTVRYDGTHSIEEHPLSGATAIDAEPPSSTTAMLQDLEDAPWPASDGIDTVGSHAN